MNENRNWFVKGMKSGVPIFLGYFAVSISLGIAAKNAGLTVAEATVASMTNNASAGQFVGFTLISAGAGYLELLIMEVIANLRYLLMSCALSQKFPENMPFFHRFIVGFGITDEIFALEVTVPKKLNPFYSYGMMLVGLSGWAMGTALGAIMGNVLPWRIVSALSIALFGMFIAIIIPEARINRVVRALVLISFAASFVFNVAPVLKSIPTGIRTIILTVAISLAAAIFFPIKDEKEVNKNAA